MLSTYARDSNFSWPSAMIVVTSCSHWAAFTTSLHRFPTPLLEHLLCFHTLSLLTHPTIFLPASCNHLVVFALCHGSSQPNHLLHNEQSYRVLRSSLRSFLRNSFRIDDSNQSVLWYRRSLSAYRAHITE